MPTTLLGRIGLRSRTSASAHRSLENRIGPNGCSSIAATVGAPAMSSTTPQATADARVEPSARADWGWTNRAIRTHARLPSRARGADIGSGVGNTDTYRVLLTARRVGPALGAAGILLVVLGVLACTRGSWPLAVLGALSVVLGGLVFLIGLGARARSNLLAGYESEA